MGKKTLLNFGLLGNKLVVRENCKHKFKPRYNRKWSTTFTDAVNSTGHQGADISASVKPYLKEETYVGDVCVKCGMTVGKEENG